MEENQNENVNNKQSQKSFVERLIELFAATILIFKNDEEHQNVVLGILTAYRDMDRDGTEEESRMILYKLRSWHPKKEDFVKLYQDKVEDFNERDLYHFLRVATSDNDFFNEREKLQQENKNFDEGKNDESDNDLGEDLGEDDEEESESDAERSEESTLQENTEVAESKRENSDTKEEREEPEAQVKQPKLKGGSYKSVSSPKGATENHKSNSDVKKRRQMIHLDNEENTFFDFDDDDE